MVSVAGGLGVIIPPSIPFVLYSLATGVSTGALFLAGVLPGLFIGICLMVYAVVYCTIHGEDKEKIMANYNKLHEKGFWQLFKESFWAFLSPVIILRHLHRGRYTNGGRLRVDILRALHRPLRLKSIKYNELGILWQRGEDIRASASCWLLPRPLGACWPSSSSGDVLKFYPHLFHGAMAGSAGDRRHLLLLGMVMDTGPAILIMAPILLPLVTQVGVNPVHFGVIMVTNLAIGLSTPPFGLDLFVASGLIKDKPIAVSKPAIPFIAAFTVALLVIVYVPKISLALLGM
ncbi:MAG: TRAP transporter large permease subunit [Cloacibacillus evryensis]